MRDSENPGRRTTDVLASDIEQFVVKTNYRMHHIFITALVSLSIIAITTAAALFSLGFIVRYNRSQIIEAQKIAKKANERSQHSAIQIELSREKVCSQSSNRRIACRALFERLAKSLSEEQRSRLACQVIVHLNGSEAKVLKEANPQCKLKRKSP